MRFKYTLRKPEFFSYLDKIDPPESIKQGFSWIRSKILDLEQVEFRSTRNAL